MVISKVGTCIVIRQLLWLEVMNHTIPNTRTHTYISEQQGQAKLRLLRWKRTSESESPILRSEVGGSSSIHVPLHTLSNGYIVSMRYFFQISNGRDMAVKRPTSISQPMFARYSTNWLVGGVTSGRNPSEI